MWAKAVASQHVRKYMFPSISLDVALSMQVPTPVMNKRNLTHMSAGDVVMTIGGRFKSGMAA